MPPAETERELGADLAAVVKRVAKVRPDLAAELNVYAEWLLDAVFPVLTLAAYSGQPHAFTREVDLRKLLTADALSELDEHRTIKLDAATATLDLFPHRDPDHVQSGRLLGCCGPTDRASKRHRRDDGSACRSRDSSSKMAASIFNRRVRACGRALSVRFAGGRTRIGTAHGGRRWYCRKAR